MTFFEDLSGKFRKYYIVPNIKCSNCGNIQEVRIPKGNPINEWLRSEAAICDNCGVASKMEIIKYKKDDEKRDEPKKREIKYW